MRIAKNTMLIAPSSIGMAIRRRRSAYLAMARDGASVEDLQQLRIVVAVVQRELAVLRVERRAHALRIARPLPGDIADGQAHQVLLEALLGLRIDRRALLHVALEPSFLEEV